jgi:hypothetical protein
MCLKPKGGSCLELYGVGFMDGYHLNSTLAIDTADTAHCSGQWSETVAHTCGDCQLFLRKKSSVAHGRVFRQNAWKSISAHLTLSAGGASSERATNARADRSRGLHGRRRTGQRSLRLTTRSPPGNRSQDFTAPTPRARILVMCL